MMVNAEDLWSEIIDTKGTGKGKFLNKEPLTKKNNMLQSDSEEEEWELESNDYADIGEEEEDSDVEIDKWEDGQENWEKEMKKLSKIE